PSYERVDVVHAVQVDRGAVGEGLRDRLDREGVVRAGAGDLAVDRADRHREVVLARAGEEGQLGDVALRLDVAGDAAIGHHHLRLTGRGRRGESRGEAAEVQVQGGRCAVHRADGTGRARASPTAQPCGVRWEERRVGKACG